MDGRREVIIDTSALINFLAVDRASLLGSHRQFEFVVTDHVRGEITDHYPERHARFQDALRRGDFRQISVTDAAELEQFGALVSVRGLGVGECAAMAVAIVRRLPLAIDDTRAIKAARKLFEHIEILNTESLVVSLIREGALTVDEADAIKEDWERNHRFRLKFKSFAERLSCADS